MSIQLTWDNPQRTVLRWIFSERWSWGDIPAHFVDLDQALASVDHDVDYIIDFSAAQAVPSFSPMQRYQSERSGSASGLMIAVGDATYAHTILQMARHLYAHQQHEPQVHFMPSLEIARNFLDGWRMTQHQSN